MDEVTEEKGPWFDKGPTEKELNDILAKHVEWINERPKDKPPENLRGIWLHRIKLSDPSASPSIRPVPLSGHDLRQAMLDDAKFGGARLGSSGFDGVELRNTKLQEASLRRAELKYAKYLTAPQLAGADLEGASIPEDLNWDQATESVRSAAGYARKLYTPIVLFSLFLGFRSFIPAENGEVGVQSIGLTVPETLFAFAAPFALLLIYIAYIFYLCRMFIFLGKMPAVFRDGTKLHEYPEPWFPTLLVRFHVKKLLLGNLKNYLLIDLKSIMMRFRLTIPKKLSEAISQAADTAIRDSVVFYLWPVLFFSVWCIAPAAILCAYFGYLKLENPLLTLRLGFIFFLVCLVAALGYSNMVCGLRRETFKISSLIKKPYFITPLIIAILFIAGVQIFITFYLSHGPNIELTPATPIFF